MKPGAPPNSGRGFVRSFAGVFPLRQRLRPWFLTAVLVALSVVALAPAKASAEFVLDMTPAGKSIVDPQGIAIFQQTSISTAGSGVIDPFLSIQQASSPTVQGFNSDASKVYADAAHTTEFTEVQTGSSQGTKSILLSSIPTVTIGGVVYREFLLDDNQTGSDPAITLKELEFYTVNNNPNIDSLQTLRSTGTLAYKLDNAASHPEGVDVLIHTDLSNGSGAADLFVYIRDDAFKSFGANTNLYLYSKFQDNNDGFEEWSVLIPPHTNPNPPEPPSVVPAPPSVVLLGIGGIGLVGFVTLSRRRRLVAA